MGPKRFNVALSPHAATSGTDLRDARAVDATRAPTNTHGANSGFARATRDVTGTRVRTKFRIRKKVRSGAVRFARSRAANGSFDHMRQAIRCARSAARVIAPRRESITKPRRLASRRARLRCRSSRASRDGRGPARHPSDARGAPVKRCARRWPARKTPAGAPRGSGHAPCCSPRPNI